jgi:hypothetical protein
MAFHSAWFELPLRPVPTPVAPPPVLRWVFVDLLEGPGETGVPEPLGEDFVLSEGVAGEPADGRRAGESVLPASCALGMLSPSCVTADCSLPHPVAPRMSAVTRTATALFRDIAPTLGT